MYSYDDNDIERVTQVKVLGVTLSADLSWNAYFDTIVSKAIYQLKRAGIRICDLLRVYVVWSYYVQMMGYWEKIVTKPYLVSKEAHACAL